MLHVHVRSNVEGYIHQNCQSVIFLLVAPVFISLPVFLHALNIILPTRTVHSWHE